MMAQTNAGGQTSFLTDQPHPENPQARCTTDEGSPLVVAVDEQARCCCGCFWKEELWLFVAGMLMMAAALFYQRIRKRMV